jgi:hypothetical protein
VISRLISGGQTGVERAALELGIPCGGSCPQGDRYSFAETPFGGH